MEPAIPVAPPRKRRSIQVENAVHASRVSTLTIESLGKKMESTPRKSVSPSMLSLDTFSDSIREVLGKNVTLYQKCMVKHEVRPDKFERKIVGLTGCRLYLFIVKTPIKVDQDHSFLDIQALESKKKNQLTITVTDGKPISLVTQDAESDDIDLMITHIGRSLKNIFPLFPIERFIKKMDVQPSDRLRPMMDIMKEIEKKDQGPCGGYSIMYACMCDFHNTPYREEVAWDVDTIYLSQDSRELNLQDFDHLNPKDLVPIIGALENNTWFTKFTASKIRLTSDAQSEILKVMKKNNALEELDLSSTGITVDFVQKLATAILSNSASQLQRIDLSKNSLDDKAMIHFIGSLKNLSKGLVHLDISNTRIIGKGLSKVAESLSQSPTIVQSLHSLNISENPGKGEDMQNLYNFLAQGNNITYLDLSGIDCALDLLCAALLRGSCASLTHLRVARNVFTNKKSKEVIVQGTWKTFFSSVYGLELLDLSGCRIPPEALKEMLLGIACNMHIKNLHLDLSSNDLQSQGGQVLGSCIGNISSITSLDISNNNLNQSIMSLLELVKSNKSVKSLSIGQNFDNIKPKLMAGVMESVVNLIQDESSCIESLSLADSKLRNNLSDIINALGSNVTLTEIDISGNQIGDFGARMLSKALQINCKLRCILWDRNLITAQGFEDIAVALQKNYALRKMPMPINDAAVALQKQGERTESALQKIESLLQRNHSPQKFSSDQAYRLQQGFLISSTQQMVDRLVVQVQDTVNALSLGSTDAYQTDIDQAASVIKDADNSKQLLPHLQRIAVQSLEAGNPVESEVKELTNNLKTTLQTQIKRIVTDMIECTGNQCAGVTADKDFMVELVSGCSDRSTLPKGFTKHLMDGVETDIYNKLSEINLAVAAHISDTVIDGVIETLTGSHKTLMSHLKQKRSENRPASADSKDKELEKVEESEKVPLRISIKADSPGNTPNLSNKRKSVHARKMRPPTVIDPQQVAQALQIHRAKENDPDELKVNDDTEVKRTETISEVGSQEDLTAVVTNHKPEKLELDTLGDLPDTSTKLTHIAKSRPRGPQRRRPSARPQENGREASDGLKADEGLDAFFTSNKAAEVGTAHSKKETPKSSKSEKKESGDKGSDKKSDLPPKPITEKPKKGWFGRNTKEQKDQPEEKAKGGIASKLFGKKGSDVKRSSSDKKEKAPQKPEIPVKVEEVSTGTKETPEEEPEIDTKSLTESSTPEATPEKKEEEKETEDTVLEEKKEEPPKRRPPVGGVGIMGGPMNVNLFSEMKTNKRFSTLNADKEERKPTVALLPPGKKSPTSNLPPPFKETAKESPLKPVEETKPEVESKVESKVENPPKVETKEEVPSTEDKASLEDKPEKEDKMERKEDKTERKEDKTERKEDKTERKEDKTEKKEDSESKPAQESKPNPAAKFGGMLNQVKAKPSPSPRTVLRKVGEDSAPSSSSSSSRSSRSSSEISKPLPLRPKPPPKAPKPISMVRKSEESKEKESSKESLAKEDVPIETESKQEADSSQSNSGVVVDSATLRLSVGEKIKRLSQKLPDPENQPTSSKSSSLPKNISLKSSVNSEVNENGESGKTDNEKEVEKSKDEKSEDSKHSSDSDKSDTLGESAIETREQLSDQEIMV
ncbi:F-actin-uncapping protein LRRC16A-like isoform X4 [Ostrea edulis]|uniref:F-actin-uncapping protein LRRC16A-like isoform X4 n=1 Tax=Ostrea edulis TaxID=37623 RepID=UPI0024AFD4C6|nr:F-actin-uncapping protein LRRC16A-like isoform X4 [Ostrea edulis]